MSTTLFSDLHIFANPTILLAATVSIVVVVHLSAWLFDSKGLHRVPGPPLAKLSSLWYAWIGRTGRINKIILEQHKKYGKVVRITPNEVSIADADAFKAIYGFGSKALKSDFYDALVQFGGTPSSFLTRSREDHARKRKFMAHGLSLRSILELEPTISKYQQQVVGNWDRMCLDAKAGKGGRIGAQTWTARDGRVWFDSMPWLNFMAFDVIGDLSFGKGFGMTASGTDIVRVSTDQKAVIKSFGSEQMQFEEVEIPVVKTILDRSEFTTASAMMPAWIRPIVRHLIPGGSKAMESFGTLVVTALAKRLSASPAKVDLLSRMIEVKDDGGKPMNRQELSAEATTLIIAGSDTTANSVCAMIYYLTRDQKRQSILQQELDDVLGTPDASESFDGHDGLYEKVKHLPYLEAVVNEGLRIYSTIGVGLPRVVPEGGLTIAGYTFAEGTVVSVPNYALHRDTSVWGPDVESFNPERWFVEDKTAMLNAFAPFSIGPRACVGRNLALTELTTTIATLLHRYHFVLERPDQELDIYEGLIRKPVRFDVGIKRRGQL